MARISVIVPVYNVENYISDCVESILTQSFCEFELILIDDGSTDRSGELCDQFAEQDDRIRVLHQANQGQAAARNNALDIAKGEWICFVDSDDLIHPQMLEVLYCAVHNTGAKISMCSNVTGIVPEQDFYRHVDLDFSVHSVDETYLTQLYEGGGGRPWTVCGKLICKDIIQKYPFAVGRIFEDNAVACRWLHEAATVADINEDLYFYRMTPVSTMRGAFDLKKLDYLWALEEIVDFYKEVDYSRLRKRFCDEYMQYAIFCYKFVCQEQYDCKYAKAIRDNLRRFIREHREFMTLTHNQEVFIWHALHPNASRVYGCLQMTKSTIVQDGILALMRKIGNYFVERLR